MHFRPGVNPQHVTKWKKGEKQSEWRDDSGSGIPTLLLSERFAPDELSASSRFPLVSSVKAIGPRAGVVGPLNELFRKTSPFARSR